MYLLMSFFDIMFLGRIVNRFLKDIDVVDEILFWVVIDFLWCLFEVVGMIVVISYVILLYLLILLFIGFFYFYI